MKNGFNSIRLTQWFQATWSAMDERIAQLEAQKMVNGVDLKEVIDEMVAARRHLDSAADIFDEIDCPHKAVR